MHMNGLWKFDIGYELDCLVFEGLDVYVKISGNVITVEDGKELNLNAKLWWHLDRFERFDEDSGKLPFDCTDLLTDIYVNGHLRLYRELLYDTRCKNRFYIRYILVNTGEFCVSVKKLTPFLVEGEDNIRLGRDGYQSWSIMRQGRHKNDLPSICKAGKTDETYYDCFVGLNESGISIDRVNPPLEMTSDSLTIIKADAIKGSGSLLIGFVTGENMPVNCRIRTDETRKKFVSLEADCLADNVLMENGEKIASEWLKIDSNEDIFTAIEDYVKDKKTILTRKPDSKLNKIPPSVYCTWYYYGDSLTINDVMINLQGLKNRNIFCDVFLIDEGWERRTGEWEANFKFPQGMKYVADKIKEAGMTPGIWTCPFIIEPRCDLQYYHPHWLLKRTDGKYVTFRMNGMYNLVLDTTHPEVLSWIERLYQKLTFEQGYQYHKLDFTRAVMMDPECQFYNRKATRVQAYRMGLEAVRKGAGENAYILVCGGLYDASLGIADGQRTGSDVLSMWPKAPNEAAEYAPYTVKQNLLRYYMNSLWDNDPDALMVRKRTEIFRNLQLSLGLLEDNEAEIFALNQYWGGGQCCFTEPVNEIDEDRLGLLRHIIPSVGQAAVPRDMFFGGRYPAIMDTSVLPLAEELKFWHTVSLVNWTGQDRDMCFVVDKNTLGAYAYKHPTFIVSDFKKGTVWENVHIDDCIHLGKVPPRTAVHLRIACLEENIPNLIYTNGHYSMGGREITSWEFSKHILHIGIDWRWKYPLLIKIKHGKSLNIRHLTDDICIFRDKDITTIKILSAFTGVITLCEEL